MNLSFDTLDIINFGSFAKQTFDLRSYPIGLHFVRGRNEYEPRLESNGAGKSSLWAAMTWCLFGKTVDGLKNPDVQPWSGKTPTSVMLHVTKKKTHTITRTIGPNRLMIDDDVCGQEQIDKLLGINFEVFTHTILLGQGQPLFFDLRPSEKMRVFAEVLNLDRWIQRSKAATNKADDIQHELDVKSGELNGIKNTLNEVQSLIDQAITKSEVWEVDREERLRNDEKQIKSLKKELAGHQNKLDKATLDHDGAGTEIKSLETELDKLKDRISDDKMTRAHIEFEIKSINRNIDELSCELEDLGKAKKCPTCGQSISTANFGAHKKELHKQIAEKQTVIKSLDKKLSAIDLTKYTVVLERLNKSYDEFKDKLYDAETKLGYYTKLVNELRVKINTLQNVIDELSNNNNPYQEQARALRKRKTKLQADQKNLDDELVGLTSKLERTRFWVKGFKDVQLYIIDEVLQELEMVSNSMLADLGLEDWLIEYAVEKETQSGSIQRGLNVTIKSPSNNKPVKWPVWSGGEGQRLRLMGALALSEVLLNHAGVDPNLIVFDEPTQGLSSKGVQNLIETLSDYAHKTKKQIFFIDHHTIESSYFDSVVTVVKTKKGSRIECEQ